MCVFLVCCHVDLTKNVIFGLVSGRDNVEISSISVMRRLAGFD